MKTIFVTTALGAVLAAHAAVAQTADDARTTAASSSDIVVTAQKRTENVQDVPKQVDVVSNTKLAAAGVSRLSELSNISPAVTATDQSQNSRAPGLRGIVSVANSIGVQSQTGIIVDDIPLPTFSTLANELTDVERVEIFAGPQSSLSGRNAAGGLINIVTRGPSFTPKADFALEQTTDEQTRFNVFATTPVSETVAFSVSAFLNHWAGNLRNSEMPGKFGGWKTKGVRGKLLWEPSSSFSVLLSGYILGTDRTTQPLASGGPYIYAASPNSYVSLDAARTPLSALPYTISKSNRTFTSADIGTANTRDKGVSLRIDGEIGDLGTLSSITSYSKSAQPRADVFFGYPNNPSLYYAYTDVDTEYVTQEVRLASPSTGPVTYLVGAIYTDTQIDQPYIRRLVFPVNWLRNVDQKSIAVFGRATWQFTANDYLTGGLRYQHDKQGYNWLFRDVTTDAVTATSKGNSGYGFFAGEVSLRHEFTPDVSAYATVSRSETGKAYDVENNAAALAGELVPLNSEKVKNAEVGIKAQLFDRRLTFNLNGFFADYSNYQVQSIDASDPTQAPVIRLLAIGKVRTKGAEMQASFRATEAITLAAGVAYTDSKIRDYPGAACYLQQTVADGCVNGTQGNIAGNTLPYAPRWKANATIDIRTPVSDDIDVTANAFFRYQSRESYDLLGNPNVRQNGFGVLNLRMGLASSERKWSIEAFVNNVTNKNYYVSMGDSSTWLVTDLPGGGTAPSKTLNARYDRSSFRYAGVRTTLSF